MGSFPTRALMCAAVVGLLGFGVTMLNCGLLPGDCIVDCLASICPLDPEAEGDSCKCPRKCPGDLKVCKTNDDCAIVDEFCCPEPHITIPNAINRAYLSDYLLWQTYECMEGPDKTSFEANSKCDYKCAALCRNNLAAVCSNTGRCTVYFHSGSPYDECIKECRPIGEADCTGRECGDDGAGGSCGECAPDKKCEDFLCVPAADAGSPD
jgi:hypothetical protein